MIAQDVYVRRQKYRLICGVVTCSGVVGHLAWDASGWPRPTLTRPVCPQCQRPQTVSIAKLEADTEAQYARH